MASLDDTVTSPHESSRSTGSGQLNRRRMLTVALGGAATVALPAPAWAAADHRPGAIRPPRLTPEDRKVVAQLSAKRALAHLKVLSEDIGPRIGGTDSERRAAHYIAGQLDKLRYDTTLQPFPVADKFLAQLSSPARLPGDLNWQVGASGQAALDTRVTASVVDVGAGTPADYPADVSGKIVLVDYVAAQREQLAATAVAAGAAAVVFLPADLVEPRRASAFSPTLPGSASAPLPIPVVGVAQAQKHRLRALLAAGPLTLTIATTAHRGLTSHNVLAERRGRSGAGGPVVMVSAHYDSVIGAPGANDDGSGTVLCLELARVLKAVPVDATLRFALWGSEEQGLIGSRYYVAQLPQAERDRILAVYQNDMVATSWDPATRYWLLSFTGESNRATDEVSAAARRLGYEPQISPVTQRGASDHQSFQEVGIASANFSWRGEESPALLEPPYHSPEDTIAKNISLERLQVSMELIGCATYATARH
ncbi:PA domain-containing protein [Micromonospora phaseoli]|uniref:PA domain-containing protein n=2 Tax=Micromonospora phaseoli TaxID=1144548 RepID=A0A1H7CRB5_9ACTN|nr:PA domain-containing protein [Micromonospora phaseoli]GIJ80767.1 aminopeptidase [Micromonospora phaseoli]SEJ92283.1 PA domain-containing protein [Micromonospora phaseoli]